MPQQNSSGDLSSSHPLPKYPSDLSTIDNQDMFDPGTGTFDLEEMLQDIRSPGIDRFGTEFNSYFPQGSKYFASYGLQESFYWVVPIRP